MNVKPVRRKLCKIIEAKLECKNASCEKIANRLSRFRGTLPFGYKVWLYDNRVFAYLKVKSISDLNELKRRLKHAKIEFIFHQIQKVWV